MEDSKLDLKLMDMAEKLTSKVPISKVDKRLTLLSELADKEDTKHYISNLGESARVQTPL